jgi:hypothetical protein
MTPRRIDWWRVLGLVIYAISAIAVGVAFYVVAWAVFG